jgi:hypothetical protein
MHRKRQKQLRDTFKTLDLTTHEELENGLWISKPSWSFIQCRNSYINIVAKIVKEGGHVRQETIQDKEL